jgi:N-acetylmuramoyl-L-alanine amidase
MHWSNPLTKGLLAAIFFCSAAAWTPAFQQGLPPSHTPTPSAGITVSSPARPQVSPQETSKKSSPEFIVIIDPSHGGEDKGATYPNKLVEKDFTLAFARELRNELEDRGISARLLRETDISLPMEKRAEITNGHHNNAIYVAIHAGLTGQGVRIYCSTLPAAVPSAGPFVPWSIAQSGALPRSRILAKAVAGELQRKQLQVARLNAPLRPLNNIITPAIAVEFSPKGADLRSPESLKMQNAVASAVAAGIASSRGQMGVHP